MRKSGILMTYDIVMNVYISILGVYVKKVVNLMT